MGPRGLRRYRRPCRRIRRAGVRLARMARFVAGARFHPRRSRARAAGGTARGRGRRAARASGAVRRRVLARRAGKRGRGLRAQRHRVGACGRPRRLRRPYRRGPAMRARCDGDPQHAHQAAPQARRTQHPRSGRARARADVRNRTARRRRSPARPPAGAERPRDGGRAADRRRHAAQPDRARARSVDGGAQADSVADLRRTRGRQREQPRQPARADPRAVRSLRAARGGPARKRARGRTPPHDGRRRTVGRVFDLWPARRPPAGAAAQHDHLPRPAFTPGAIARARRMARGHRRSSGVRRDFRCDRARYRRACRCRRRRPCRDGPRGSDRARGAAGARCGANGRWRWPESWGRWCPMP